MIKCYRRTAGTTPAPFVWVVTDADDNPIDLTGGFPVDTVTFTYRLNGGAPVTRTGDQVDLVAGVIGWTPIAADFAAVATLEGTAYYHSGSDKRDGAQIQITITAAEGSGTGEGPDGNPGWDGIYDGGSL